MEEPTKTPKRNKKKEEGEFNPPLTPGDDPNVEKQSMLSKYSPVIMPVLFALVISFFLINLMAVSKGTYNNAVVGLSGRIGAVETSITTITELPETVAAQILAIEEAMANFQPNVDEINNLAVEINNLQAQVAGLNIPSQSSLTAMIDNSMATLEGKLLALELRLDDLEDEIDTSNGNGDDPVVTDDITLWSKELYSTSNITIDYTISPTRVEEEGDYIIMVYLYNYDLTVKNDVVVDIIFSPKTGDRVKVDETEVYLDSTRTPFYAWFGDVVKRSDGTVRRMVFTSEKMAINAGQEVTIGDQTGIDPGRLALRLEFTLAYE